MQVLTSRNSETTGPMSTVFTRFVSSTTFPGSSARSHARDFDRVANVLTRFFDYVSVSVGFCTDPSPYFECETQEFAPYEILPAYTPATEIKVNFPDAHRSVLSTTLRTCITELPVPSESEHADLVLGHMAQRTSVREQVFRQGDFQCGINKEKHDFGVYQHTFTSGELVMLFEQKSAGKKFRPR